MRLFSFLLCLFLSMSAIASSMPVQRLEKGLDEYHFALTVEWDQQDKDFYNKKTEEFFAVIREAISEGFTKEQVLKLLEKKIKDPVALEALKLKVEILSPKADSQQELAELLRISSDDMYQRGASWDGEVATIVGISVVGAALIGYAIWWNIKYKCVSEEVYRDCGWETDRNGRRDYRCRNKTRCLEWVER